MAFVDSPNRMNRGGSIHLIKGPMFSGKTTELTRRHRIQKIALSIRRAKPESILLVRFAGDERYSNEGLATHDRAVEKSAVSVNDLEELAELAERADHIYIDEGQFFKGLKNHCLKWAKQGKEVVVAALDAYGNHPGHDVWPEIAALEPCCVEVTKLVAVCFKCGGPAPLTLALSGSAEPTEKVGGSETYLAVCIHCCEFGGH